MTLTERTAYIKGLCDGLDLDKTTKEGKLIAALLDMVTEMAAEMDDMQAEICELKDYCEELDEDLGDGMDYVKKLKKASEITEDDQKKAEKDLQDLLDKMIKKADAALAAKEKELMSL